MEFLESLDTQLLLFINSCNSPFFDFLFFNISKTVVSIPLFLFVIWKFFTTNKTSKALIILLFVVASVGLADIISVHCFKEVFLRYRPSHNGLIQDKIHIIQNYRGGLYGFISSHASNTFAFALFSSLILKNRLIVIILFLWAAIVSFSRVYLGVHYPADVAVGASVGLVVSFGLYTLFEIINSKFIMNKG